MKRLMLGLGIVGGLLLWPATGLELSPPAAHAHPAMTHTGVEHCQEDPNADEVIDTGDLVLFTGLFGQPNPPPHLDIRPLLAPDGYVDTQEIAAVTALFGAGCAGSFGEGWYSSGGEGAEPLVVYFCNHTTWTRWWNGDIGGAGPDGLPLITIRGGNWGGITNCQQTPGNYVTYCHFQLNQYDSQQGWQVVAAMGTTETAGTYCAQSGHPVRISMFKRSRGSMYHIIYDCPSGGCHVTHPAEFHGGVDEFVID